MIPGTSPKRGDWLSPGGHSDRNWCTRIWAASPRWPVEKLEPFAGKPRLIITWAMQAAIPRRLSENPAFPRRGSSFGERLRLHLAGAGCSKRRARLSSGLVRGTAAYEHNRLSLGLLWKNGTLEGFGVLNDVVMAREGRGRQSDGDEKGEKDFFFHTRPWSPSNKPECGSGERPPDKDTTRIRSRSRVAHGACIRLGLAHAVRCGAQK